MVRFFDEIKQVTTVASPSISSNLIPVADVMDESSVGSGIYMTI